MILWLVVQSRECFAGLTGGRAQQVWSGYGLRSLRTSLVACTTPPWLDSAVSIRDCRGGRRRFTRTQCSGGVEGAVAEIAATPTRERAILGWEHGEGLFHQMWSALSHCGTLARKAPLVLVDALKLCDHCFPIQQGAGLQLDCSIDNGNGVLDWEAHRRRSRRAIARSRRWLGPVVRAFWRRV